MAGKRELMPRLTFSAELPCSAAQAWEDFCRPAHLLRISQPLLRIEPLAALPETYREGDRLPTRLHMLGRVPWGDHTIEITRVRPLEHTLETQEFGNNIRSWRHRFQVESLGASACRCRDVIDFEAGIFNAFVWCYSQVLYRHRYAQWKRYLEGANRGL